MIIVSCEYCGVEFEAKTRRKRWCSHNCNSFARGRDCSVCGARMHASSVAAEVPECKDCRKPKCGHVSMYARGCRCQLCKEAKADEMREYAAQRRAVGNPMHRGKATVDRECEFCGVTFAARVDGLKRGRGRFCSNSCGVSFRHKDRPIGERERARRDRHREFGKMGSVRWRALRRAMAALELSGGSRVFVSGPCVVCGKGFTGVGHLARYCSHECASRNMPDSFGIRWLDRMYLYDRDEWKCHLCGLEVVYGVDDYDPRMATLDHLVPQSLGGGHEFENLATAHLLCNSIRRELPVEEFRSGEAVAMLRRRLADSMGVAA